MISSESEKQTVSIGDSIRFFPDIELQSFSETDNNDLYFEHVILNVYEFSFVPKVRILTEGNGVASADHLIETPKFIGLFFTLDPENQSLKVGQWYRGYGKFRNYLGSPFRETPSVDQRKVEALKVNAKVESVLDYDISNTWHENKETRIFPSISGVYKSIIPDDPDYKYYNNFEQFKKLVAPYKNKYREIASSKSCLLPTYRLKIS